MVVVHDSKSSKISTRWYQYTRNVTQYLMGHTLKTPSIHVYFTQSEEAYRCILYLSLLCLINYPNIYWNIFTQALQATQSHAQLSKGANNLLCMKKCRASKQNPNSSNPSGRAIKKTPKGHTKNIPFVFCTILTDKICHMQLHANKLNNVLYFPDSPVNIKISTVLA